MTHAIAVIKSGREKPILQQHPWIFSGAIDRIEGDPNPGDIITVQSHNGDFLGRGYWNPASQIRIRVLTWQDEPVDEAWWQEKIGRAIDARRTHYTIDNPGTACRLINAENDYLPGLIVDKYGDWIVLQALTLGIEVRKQLIAEHLANMLHPRGIYERSDVHVRQKEGLSQATGTLWGEEPPKYVVVDEGIKLRVDVRNGHKTGLYLDQMDNQRLLAHLITNHLKNDESPSILNLFSYTGGFGLHALKHPETRVTNVDASYDVLQLAEENVLLNQMSTERVEFIQADAFEYLRDMVELGTQHECVILDPPKFAHNKRQIEKAARGYKDINMNAFKIVKLGGYLITFSCSGAVDADLFQKIVFGAMVDSGRQAQVLKHLGPGPDHPVALTFPEGMYLKGLLLRVF